MFNSSTIPLLEQVVNFTETRHGVLAGNIANLDTPGYRTRDVSPELFQQRLKEALESRHKPASATDGYGNYGSLSAYTASRAGPRAGGLQQVADSMKSILRHDDVDVGMEQQINAMVKNQSQHNLAIGIMSAQFRLLRAAITERVV
jgi:flagellar basal-body rod protein FlgB